MKKSGKLKHFSKNLISNDELVEILNKKLKYVISSSRYLIQDADINDYYLLSNLEEINMNRTKLLELVLWCLVKPSKIQIDYDLIYHYLFFMREFTQLLKKQSLTNPKELIEFVALHLEYQNFPENKIICRFGDKGNRAFIVLNGEVDILIKQRKKVRLLVENFYLYIAALLKYKEYMLLLTIIQENQDNFPFQIINDEEYDDENSLSCSNANTYIKSLGNKKKDFNNFLNLISSKYSGDDNIPTVKISYLNQLFTENIPDFSELFIDNISTEEYINRLKVYKHIDYEIDNPNIKLFDFIVYDYVKILTKKTGSLIGEMALSDSLSQRNATMITSNDCDFGVLKKKAYDLSIKLCTEKVKRQNINFLLALSLFKNLTFSVMYKKYYNNFISCSFNKGTKICNMYHEINNIFFIREGDFEISIKMSFSEIIELLKYYLDQIDDYKKINHIKQFLNLEHLQTLAELRAFFGPERNRKFLEEKRYIKLFSVSTQEIIGLEYFMNVKTRKSFYDVECSSIKGEGMQISYDFFNSIKGFNASIRNNEHEFIQEKYIKLVQRLLTIRQSLINTFYAHESKEKGSKIEDEITLEIEREKNYKNLFFGKRNFMFNKTDYNFRKFHPIKLHKHTIKKTQIYLNSFERKNNDSGEFIFKNRIERKKRNFGNKYQLSFLSSYNFNHISSNERLENEITKAQINLFKTRTNQFFEKNKNNKSNNDMVLFNDMIWEDLDSKINKSFNDSFIKNNKTLINKKTLNSNCSIDDFTENSKNNTINNRNTINKNNLPLSIRQFKSKSLKTKKIKLKHPIFFKGRCHYDELRKLQIKILKK